MAAWETADMSAALEGAGTATTPFAQTEASGDPQAHGWAAPTAIDYARYHDGAGAVDAEGAALFDEVAARRFPSGPAGNAVVYEWRDEYGDVGPHIPEVADILFPKKLVNNNGTGGVNWDGISKIPVTQEGSVKINPARNFEGAGLHPVMLENVKLCGYTAPTPVQAYTMPAILKNHDIIACAQTGSGKTVAFLLPVLSKFMGKAKKWAAPRPNPATYDINVHGQVRAEPLAVIICPTRELAIQIFDEARKLCYRSMLRPAVVYGGTSLKDQIEQLSRGADILIGTPGRLIDFINRPQLLSLRRLRYMIIDEADEMLHNDWEADFKQIMTGGDQEPGNITYLMFSATFPKAVRDLARTYLREDHVRIRVGRIGSTHENIKQDVIFVEPSMKKDALLDLLMSKPPARTIIFVNSKRAADEIDDFLFNKRLPCTSVHGDRTQREREDSMRAFRAGTCPILIATGVSARGIDVELVMHVINFDLPSHQHGGIEEYTHRIGRTGRCGLVGYSTSFYGPRDADLGPSLVKTLCETHQPVPDFLEEFLPEGFTADGQGDVNTLKFDADSDAGDDENGQTTGGGQEAGAWGANADPTVTSAGASQLEASTVAAPFEAFTTATPHTAWGADGGVSVDWGTPAGGAVANAPAW